MFKASDFKNREVVNLTEGEKLGYVYDLEIDEFSGNINSIVVPGKNRNSFFGKKTSIVIPWNKIEKFGDDIILVRIPLSDIK